MSVAALINLGRYRRGDMVEIETISHQYYHNQIRDGAVHAEITTRFRLRQGFGGHWNG
jgi:hypothetical protein